MATGPFSPSLLPVYDLQFSDEGGSFTIRAHLSKTGERTANKLGLDIEASNLTVLCHDPKAGSSRVKHDMVATVSPDWDGLTGTFRVKAQPDSSFIPITQALGRTYYGTFEESASSASNDMTLWTRRRRTSVSDPDGLFDRGQWGSTTVMLYVEPEKGDELDPLGPVRVAVTAVAGTLLEGDLISDPLRGTYQIRELARDGEFEHARAER